jgi:hypothetical protein
MEIKSNGFVFLPSVTGNGVLVRRDQIVGARPNGPNEGSILYTEAGPSIYTALTTAQLANLVSAERVDRT